MSCKCGPSIIIFTLTSLLHFWGFVMGIPSRDAELAYRRNFVREMMKGAWNSYRAHAWGEYAVFPLTNEPAYDAGRPGKFQVGATILASLDTLYIMDLKDEFELGRTWIKNSLHFTSLDGRIEIDHAFEEYAASLLSAYFLTNDYDLVLKAQEIVESFLPNFVSSTGLPYRARNPAKNQTDTSDVATYLSELGAFRLESLALSNLTGKQEFKLKTNQVTEFLKSSIPPDGLFRDTIDVRKGQHYEGRDIVYPESVFHLTLINDWLQHGNIQAREMFDQILTSFIQRGILKLGSKSSFVYLTEKGTQVGSNLMCVEYCMSAGVYALAAMSNHSAEWPAVDYNLLSIARNLTQTCQKASQAMTAGLAPRKFSVEAITEEIFPEEGWNNLGPHIAYSYFVLYRLTGDPIYREWGWEMTQYIERYAKADAADSSMAGYAGLLNVVSHPPIKGGIQEPHFLGGTLKFLYLLFSDAGYYDLRNWVFNAKGHLMPVAGPSRLNAMKENESAKSYQLTQGYIALYLFVACAIACVAALLLWLVWRQGRENAPTTSGESTQKVHFTQIKPNDGLMDLDSNYGPVFNGVTGLI